MLHAKSQPVNFKALPPLHTVQSAADNKLQMDIVNIPSAITQMAYNQVYIFLSLLTTPAFSNIDMCYHKILFSNSIGKQYLDEYYFLSKDILNAMLFLQAYLNWFQYWTTSWMKDWLRGGMIIIHVTTPDRKSVV